MADNKIEQLKKLLFEKYKTRVFFSNEAIKDYKSFSPGKRNDVLKLILKQAEKGALFKPDGNANRCEGQLHQFAKIKSKQLNLRIIYQPQLGPDDVVEMGIIAIGPRDDLEVYKMAIRRLADE
jgi:mRNA interferase RelE/StbE